MALKTGVEIELEPKTRAATGVCVMETESGFNDDDIEDVGCGIIYLTNLYLRASLSCLCPCHLGDLASGYGWTREERQFENGCWRSRGAKVDGRDPTQEYSVLNVIML